MAGIGGFIVGKEKVINYLRYNMRSQIFDESLPLAMVLGLQKRLAILRSQPERRKHLWEVAHALQDGLRSAGYDLGTTRSAITPVYIHPKVAVKPDDSDGIDASADDLAINAALNLVMDMRENYGIFCTIVKYPAVPPGTLMIRFMPTASHSIENVEYTVKSMAEMKRKLDDGAYDNQSLLK